MTADTGRTNPNPGTENTKGYTGLEGLLNYAYYQAGAVNQFDQIGHLLHFSLYNVFTGPCGNFVSGRNPQTGEPGVPADGGGTTTNILEAEDCISWLGPNQPGINEDLGLPPYDPSVCPNGTAPAAAQELCNPEGQPNARANAGGRSPQAGRGSGGGSSSSPRTPAAAAGRRGRPGPRALRRRRTHRPAGTDPERHPRPDPRPAARGARPAARTTSRTSSAAANQTAPQPGGGAGAATDDLLDFLFN